MSEQVKCTVCGELAGSTPLPTLETKTPVFVAMHFEAGPSSVFDNAIKPAIERAGYTAYRVDRDPHIDRIDAKIMAEIKDSRFLVADVTGQRNGVYFETGYALGLGLPVIWTVRRDDLENVHFDTRQYSHIVWETEQEFHDKLYDLIRAIIGKGMGKSD